MNDHKTELGNRMVKIPPYLNSSFLMLFEKETHSCLHTLSVILILKIHANTLSIQNTCTSETYIHLKFYLKFSKKYTNCTVSNIVFHVIIVTITSEQTQISDVKLCTQTRKVTLQQKYFLRKIYFVQ